MSQKSTPGCVTPLPSPLNAIISHTTVQQRIYIRTLVSILFVIIVVYKISYLFCLRWRSCIADMSELLTPLLSRIRIPSNNDRVYKDECAFCFDSPVCCLAIEQCMGNLRKCGMRKVICGTKPAEWRWLVDGHDHVISLIPQITAYLPSLTWW